MIGRLVGQVAAKSPPQVLIDVQGVGYEVEVPMSTFCALPANGGAVSLLIHQVVREDAHILFGFLASEEREAFRQLIRIAGVGPRTALALLSGLSVSELAAAVAQQEPSRLVKVPGIGKKTAERLLLELKGKLVDALPATSLQAQPARGDIAQALLALGYNEREAEAAMKALPTDVSVSEGIRLALKALSR